MAQSFYQWRGNTLLLTCQLQPNAAADKFAGLYSQRLKIRINAPPVDGKANARLIKFLSKQFGVAKSAITIERGELGRQKGLAIERPTQLPAQLGIEKPPANN